MRICGIKTKNYRVLENSEIPFGDNYCTISGKNNAGKSCIIQLLSALLWQENTRPWVTSEAVVEYKEDKTQWLKDDSPIEVEYRLLLNKKDDASLVTFIGKLADSEMKDDDFEVIINAKYKSDGESEFKVGVEDKIIDGSLAKDVVQKLKTSNLLFLHNSTHQEEVYYSRGRRLALVEFILNENEKSQIIQAEASIQKRIKKFAKQHKEELQNLLGKMEEKYSVEFSTLDASYTRHIPLGVRLVDKQVNVPINEWGSGTQNKTYILLSVLWANRIKTQGKEDDKITPIVVIEEPESFLHPTAQAEFGKLLSSLALELEIQIIVTTHSPYMLNRTNPQSNILVRRPLQNKKRLGSEIVIPKGADWMLPFSEQLGLPKSEFDVWEPIFSSGTKRILLVEGPIDKEYLSFLHKQSLLPDPLPEDIDIVPYGGKDALKNTVLLKFTLDKYDEAYITFDLDAINDVKRPLEAIGYTEGVTYFPIGKKSKGHQDIEGLLPERVRTKVFGQNAALVTSAIGGDRDAKNQLKNKYLEEFKSITDYTEEELKGFIDLIKAIKKGIKANNRVN
jgi:predicted ATP-dependent endonuclease of OLD family